MFTNKVSGPGSSDNRAPSEHQDVSISRPTRYFPALLAQAQLTLKVSTKVLLLKERHSLSCSFIVLSSVAFLLLLLLLLLLFLFSILPSVLGTLKPGTRHPGMLQCLMNGACWWICHSLGKHLLA